MSDKWQERAEARGRLLRASEDRERALESALREVQEDCVRLQQEINCLWMEPCQLPHCVSERGALKEKLNKIKAIIPSVQKVEQERDNFLQENRRFHSEIRCKAKIIHKGLAEIDKLKAEKMAEALRSFHSQHVACTDCKPLKEALAAFDEAEEKP